METKVSLEKKQAKGRMANFELLRCIAMIFIITTHFLDKGKLLPALTEPSMTANGYMAWILETVWGVASLNVYMMLSGYFMVEASFKVKRFLQFLLQVWFYSIGIGIVGFLLGIWPKEEISIYHVLQIILPISREQYWYVSAYVLVYLLSPFLIAGVKKMTKKQFQIVLLLLLFFFSFVKTVVPFRLETDGHGYDAIWYLCMFLIAAYIRMYGIPFFKNKLRSFLVYLGATACMLGETFLLRMIYLKTGKMSALLGISYDHNHVFLLLAGISLFYFFYHVKIKEGIWSRLICKAGPFTLGVYLLHEHIALKTEWPKIFIHVFGEPNHPVMLTLLTLVATLSVFCVGVLIDALRSKVFGWCDSILQHIPKYKKLNLWLNELIIK